MGVVGQEWQCKGATWVRQAGRPYGRGGRRWKGAGGPDVSCWGDGGQEWGGVAGGPDGRDSGG